MIERLNGVTIWSSDVNNLLPFYRDTLGLPVQLESPRFVMLGDGEGAPLCLGSHSEVRGNAADPYRFLVQLQTNDLKADVERFRAAGVEIFEEPNDQGEGFWLATLKDPEGNLVQLTCWEPGMKPPGR